MLKAFLVWRLSDSVRRTLKFGSFSLCLSLSLSPPVFPENRAGNSMPNHPENMKNLTTPSDFFLLWSSVIYIWVRKKHQISDPGIVGNPIFIAVKKRAPEQKITIAMCVDWSTVRHKILYFERNIASIGLKIAPGKFLMVRNPKITVRKSLNFIFYVFRGHFRFATASAVTYNSDIIS